MAKVMVKCENCLNTFEAKSRKARFCSFVCRNEFITKSKGELSKDYVICELCKRAVVSVTGIHMKTYHPRYSPESYRLEFPNAQSSALSVFEKKSKGGKKGGERMREAEHRERMSEAYKGERNPMHKSNVTEEFRKSISTFNPSFYQKKFPDLSLEECKNLANEKQRSIKRYHVRKLNIGLRKDILKKKLK